MNNKHGVIFVLLDLSAVFDTIDHKTLLHQFQCRLGISGTALKWFQSCLTYRTLAACVEGEFSTLYLYKMVHNRDRCLNNSYTPFLLSHLVAYLGKLVFPTICVHVTPSCTLHLISLTHHYKLNP